MAQSGNPGSDSRFVSDVPTQKYEGSRGLRSDGVALRMTESEKYKLRLTPSRTTVLVKQVIGNNRRPGLCLYDLPTSLKGGDVAVPSQLEPLTLDPP